MSESVVEAPDTEDITSASQTVVSPRSDDTTCDGVSDSIESSSSLPTAADELTVAPQAVESSYTRYRFDNLLQVCLEGVKMRPKVQPCVVTPSSIELADQVGSSLVSKKAVLNSFGASHKSVESGTCNEGRELEDLSPNDLDLDSSIALNSTFEAMSATVAAEKIMDDWSSSND